MLYDEHVYIWDPVTNTVVLSFHAGPWHIQNLDGLTLIEEETIP
jgi:hypothetical protein